MLTMTTIRYREPINDISVGAVLVLVSYNRECPVRLVLFQNPNLIGDCLSRFLLMGRTCLCMPT